MPARANSSATISFGLVSIPVKVYTANRSKSVSFNMLHAKDKSRLKQQYVCATCGEPVESADRVKGYEYAKDQYVVMSDEELKALERKSDRTIEIEEFIPMERVDALYYEKAQLLGPDKGGAKAYRLLNEAMLTMGKVAIGRHHVRGREQLVLVRPLGRGLVLQGLYYADEVAKFDEIEFGDEVELKKGELDLAQQLIEQLASERFQPEKYEDEYRRELLSAIDRKVAGEEVVSAPRAEQREQIIDLVAALKKSLEEKRGGAGQAKVTPDAAAERVRKPARAKGKSADAKRARG
ncbi:MAG: Ku protein [Deltaproteobacteria bacterium]|nr:Ku protein [Deltaproteobacteria bacterium]